MADKSTIELDGDSADLEEALDESLLAFEDFGDGVESNTEDMQSFWSKAMDSMSSTASDLFGSAVDSIVGYVSSMFDEISARISKGTRDFMASQQEVVRLGQALRATGNVSGWTADQLEAIADTFSKMTTYSAEAFRSAEMALIKFGNVRGDVFKDALMAAANLAAITGDLTGAADKLGEALHDPAKGIEMLKEAGYKFSKSQEDMISKMMKANDIIGLQNMLLDIFADITGGNAKEQAETFGGQITLLNNIFDSMFEKIGSMLVPTMTQYLIPAMQKVGNIVEWLVEQFKDSGDAIGEFIESGIEVAADLFEKFVEAAVTAFSYVQSAIEEFGSFFEGSWQKIKEVTFTVLADVIEVLQSWVEKAIDLMKEFFEFMKQVWQKVLEVAAVAWDGIAKGWQQLTKYLANVLAQMLSNVGMFWEGVKKILSGETFEAAFGVMEKGFNAGIDKMKDKFKDIVPNGNDFDIDDFVDGLRKGAKKAAEDSGDAFKDFDEKFAENLEKNKDKVEDFIEKLKDIMSGKGLESPGESDKDFIKTKGDKENGEKGERSMGGIEDLISLNKRIQGAALSPEVSATKEQTDVLKEWMRLDIKANDDVQKLLGNANDLLAKGKKQPAQFGD